MNVRAYTRRVAFITAVIFIPLLCLASQDSGSVSKLSLVPAYFPGMGNLKSGNYEAALQELLSDSLVTDSIQRVFQLANIHHKLSDHSKALFLYRLAAQKNEVVAPVAYTFIGDIEYEQGRVQNSLTAYRAALGHRIPQKYKIYVFGKIRKAVEQDSSGLSDAGWLEEFRRWRESEEKVKLPDFSDTVDAMIKGRNWSVIDSLLDTMVLSGKEGCRIAKLVFSSDSQQIGGKNQFKLANAAAQCKDWKTADGILRNIAAKKGLMREVPEGRYLYLRAQVYYQLGMFEESIKTYRKIDSKYGSDANVLMSLARAYRKIGKADEADKWYERHLKEYPSHSRNQEIMWLKAWRMEEKGKINEAGSVYRQIYTRYPKGSRRDESYLRHALCFYKQEKYDSALTILDNFTKKYPYSKLRLSISYWKGKCLLALDKTRQSRKVFREISAEEPYDYYAHRSRQVLSLLGDTAEFALDTVSGLDHVFQWLDSISPAKLKKDLSASDSIDYIRGIYLASIGETEAAEYFLEKLETSFPANLSLQLELSLLYYIGDSPAQAYRVARRLTWRIPVAAKGRMPLGLYRFLYPSFFGDIIREAAAQHNVDPYLVSAVIRQESIFNPVIKSPVGAIGLMQIMPYTGKYIAEKVKVPFANDSLSCPLYNVRFGTFYIRELLDEFNDNVVLVLAGYNGGPHNARKWFSRNKEEEYDLFVEDIAFSETRDYVKKVLANYWTYRVLAGNSGFAFGVESALSAGTRHSR